MLPLRHFFIIFLGTVSFFGRAQNYSVGFQDMIFIGQMLDRHNPNYDFQFYGERYFDSQSFSFGFKAGARKFVPEYPDYYQPYVGGREFSQESWAVGGFGRKYLYEGTFRLFAEGTVYYNHLNYDEIIIIPLPFSVYEREIRGRNTFWSASLGLGFSVQLGGKAALEAHVQYGAAEEFEVLRAGPVSTASIGIMEEGDFNAWAGSFLAFKFFLG